MNEIAAKLGEVGLPAPVSELAPADWDVVVVGGGHNGLTAAAYLARAGQSVLVLERRERLGGACTLERPFADERLRGQPLRLRRRPARRRRHRRARPRDRRGFAYWMADPNLWVPFEDGTSFGQFLDDARTQASLDALGLSKRDIDGYWAYEELFDDVRKLLRKGERDTWVGDTPTRAEIEEMLGGDEEMIDLVFEDSIAEVLDRYIADERLKTALYGQGIIGTWGGPYEPGHRLDQADALPGRPGRPGPGLGLRRGRHGDDLASRSPTPPARPARRSPAASRSPRSSPARASSSRTGRRSGPGP